MAYKIFTKTCKVQVFLFCARIISHKKYWGCGFLKGNELKDRGIKFRLGEKEYELKFNLNTFCELEEIYGDLNKAFEDLQRMKIKAVRALVYAAVKVEDESVTLKNVGALLGLDDLERLGTVINEALSIAMPEVDETSGEVTATQVP